MPIFGKSGRFTYNFAEKSIFFSKLSTPPVDLSDNGTNYCEDKPIFIQKGKSAGVDNFLRGKMITQRLQGIIDMVSGEVAADIGCDHAYVPIRLIKEGHIKRAIACDKNKGPAGTALDNIRRNSLEDVIEVRVGEGLLPLSPGEADIIIIAGMGGKLIGDIIEQSPDVARYARLVLQPMNFQAELRKKLFSLGYSIEKEGLRKEGFKIYNIFSAVKKEAEEKPPILYHLPKELFSDPLFPMLVDKKEREFNKIINGQKLSGQSNSGEIKKYEELLFELLKIRREIL